MVVDTGDGNTEVALEVKLPGGDYVPCDSPEGARQLVTNTEGQLVYAGQALINRTCAFGQCHNAGAEGEQRLGAPAGLDFDLPLVPRDESGHPDDETLLRLQLNQRAVYDARHGIWTQVDEGHMPPGGVGQPFREDPGLRQAEFDATTGECSAGEPVGPITEKQAQDMLAVWLACGSPLVESSASELSGEGSVGDLTPTCGSIDPVDEEVTFERVYAEVIQESCVDNCHEPDGIREQTDYSTIELAYDNTVGAPVPDTPGCPDLPAVYVEPNDPEASYLLHKMGDSQLADPVICGATMPFGVPPLQAGTALVRAWIEAGAPGPGEAPQGPAGDGGVEASGDAGLDGGL